MDTSLETMSAAELGHLFPISIVPYRSEWPTLFDCEKQNLLSVLGHETALRIEHFGSTAVPGLAAKDCIDILLEIAPRTQREYAHITSLMSTIGYLPIWRSDDELPYMMYVKGYTTRGFEGQTFHVHIAAASHPLWSRLSFRDALRTDPALVRQYENLKLSLAVEFRNDRDGYTNAKSDFVRCHTSTLSNCS